MTSGLFEHFGTALQLVFWLSLAPLTVAAAVGLLAGVLLAVTSIQEQSLPQTAKLIAIIVTLALAGPTLAAPLLHHAERVFADVPAFVR
jgi:type III secretion protein S